VTAIQGENRGDTASSIEYRRAALLTLLKRDGVLWAGPNQPVVDRRGVSAPWMFYSWNVSLTAEGAELAARCLLDRLQDFHSTQLATSGTTGIPLLTASVLLGQGRYTGICVRDEPKGHSGGRQIEGPVDASMPIVLVDDSLSSGTSLLKGIRVLERHGLQVEGAVCLVHFPGRGGRERLEALGFRVETLFDIWRDLKMVKPGYVPGYQRVGDFVASNEAVHDGLPPASVARAVAKQFLRDGTVPKAPGCFDAQYEASGGVWVSFRDRRTNFRLARDGFWHFDPGDADPCRDVVLATVKTVRTGNLRWDQLDNLKIGVTFFGPLESIQPSGLDFDRYGIVVRSTSWPVKVGGALPNTQVFTSEREQLDLAKRNASLGPLEPYELFRHSLSKHLEPGDDWPPYGVPDPPEHNWTVDAEIGEALTHRALQAALAGIRGEPVPQECLPADLIPSEVAAVGVSFYHHGITGCAMSGRKNLDDAVVAAAQAAIRDTRFTKLTSEAAKHLCPAISILYDPEQLGWTSAEKAARKLRLGRDSLLVQQGERSAYFLESVGPHYEWDKDEIAKRLLQKAIVSEGDAFWTTFRTATWFRHENLTVRHLFGFAEPSAENCNVDGLESDLALLGGYIFENRLENGLPCYARYPVTGWVSEQGSAARVVFGLTGLFEAGRYLDRADWRQLAVEGLRYCLDHVEFSSESGTGSLRLEGQRCGPMADCTLLSAATLLNPVDIDRTKLDALAARVLEMFRADGSIYPEGQTVRADRDNDYLPNAAMLAIAAYRRRSSSELAEFMEPHRVWQMRRFRSLPGWGQAGWLPQSCAEVFRSTNAVNFATTAFEVSDWCLDRQVEATGAFLIDLAPGGPTFHTAFIAEAIADAWELALMRNDRDRAQRLEQSWWAAVRFARRLILRPVDAPCFADSAKCIGGVRGAITTSVVRIDYVSHLAIALVKGLRLAGHESRKIEAMQ
jgi:orotate phosphoribosyltransferase/AMMECR1 domain-containing protein